MKENYLSSAFSQRKKNTLLKTAKASAATKVFKRVFFATQEKNHF